MSTDTTTTTTSIIPTRVPVPVDELPPLEARKQIKEKFIGWSQSSTSHGYPNIFRTKNLIVQIMWSIFFLVGLCVSIYFVTRSISEYFDYTVTTRIRMLKTRTLVFPTVSICNSNPFVTDSGVEFIANWSKEKYGSDYLSPAEIRMDNISLEDDLDMIRQKVASTSFNSTLRETFGYNLSEMVLECSYNSMKCNFDEFERFYDPYYGNCFRFNSGYNASNQKIDLKTSNRYAKDGLIMSIFTGKLRTNKSRLFYDYNKFSGLRIVIHDQSIKPDFNEGHFYKPGTFNRITLNKIVSETKPEPYSSCQDLTKFHSTLYDLIAASNYSYRQSDCFNLCYQKAVVDACGCYDVDYIELFDSPPCLSYADYTCILDIYFSFRTFSHDFECEKQCPLECESTLFRIEKSFGQYPSREYAVNLQNDSRLAQLEGYPMLNYSILEQTLLGISISYDEIQFMKISEEPSVTFFGLIANVGGTLGLFMGVSLLTFIEMFEILIKVCNIAIKKLTKKLKRYEIS